MARFDAALQCDSSDAEVYKLRSELHARAGNFSMALEDLAAVLRLDPNNTEALTMKGEIHSVMGEVDQARQHWQAAADRGNRAAITRLADDLIAKAAEAARKQQHSTVIGLCGEAIDRGAVSTKAYRLKGGAHYGLGEYSEALQDLAQAIALASKNTDALAEAEALVQRGNTYMALQRRAEAEADWRRAASLGYADIPTRPEPGNKPVTALGDAADCMRLFCVGLDQLLCADLSKPQINGSAEGAG